MKLKKVLSLALALMLAVPAVSSAPKEVKADNPIVQTYYTADPSPIVVGDTLYLITSHDEDILETNNPSQDYDFYTMKNWKCYSTKDMINWTDHGTIFGQSEFEWGHDWCFRAWASQCVERDGKYYLYVPILRKANYGQPDYEKSDASDPSAKQVVEDGTKPFDDKKMCYLSFVKRLIPDIEVGDYVSFTDSPGYGIGVAVADTPYGPYKDAIGEPLITGDWNDIDPTVYIDDDGQAYLFYGQTLKYCLLNDDMISLKTQPAKFNVPNYVEGPWFTKHNGKYYFMWAANGGAVSSEHKGGENLQYAYCDEPLGNYTYGGILQETTMGNSFTNHPGVCDFQGRSYLFYHTNVLPAGGYNSYHRSVCVSEMFYNDDGTIELVPMPDSVEPIDTFNPYNKTEAETIAWETGVKTGWDNGTPICNGESVYVYNMHDTDYIQLRNVDFGNEGAVSFTASVRDAKNDAGASIEIYVDDDLVGTVEVDNYSDQWKEISTKLTKTVTGVHDLRFEFKGAYEKPENETGEPNNPDALVSAEDTGMFKFDYWKFDTQSMLPTPTPVVTAAPVATAVPNDQNAQATPSPAPVAKVKVAKVKGLKIKKSGKKATVSWQKASGAKKYEVYYGSNKNFKKATKKIVVKNKVVIKKLKKGKTYYFKVRGFANVDKGRKVYGSFSAKKKIRL